MTYLDIISRLHERYAALPAKDLRTLAAAKGDPLTRWVAGYLLKDTADKSLQPMLDEAMQRRYSSSPRETLLHRRRRAHLRQFPAVG